MALLVKQCDRHPDRKAIGVCVVTKRAICRECSTQYQGVNYSREGLEQLLAQERSAASQAGRSHRLLLVLVLACAPLAGYVTYLTFAQSGQVMVDLMQADYSDFGG